MRQDKIEIPQGVQTCCSGPSPSIRIANLHHIDSVWGRSAAAAVLEAIRGRARDLGALAGERPFHLLDLYETLSSEPVVVAGTLVHAVVVADAASHAAAPVGLLPSDETAVELYRADMRDAAIVFRALKEGQIRFSLQPILDARTREIFYEEALSRFPGPGGNSPLRYIEAVERLGLAQAFDGQVVSLVLAQLGEAPSAVLGVNVSAQSVLPGGWRDNLATELAARPDLASRLVIEITESAPLPSIFGAQRIIHRLRETGCRFALDDFGVKYSSVEYMLELRPDIIKIDRKFLKAASSCEQGRDILSRIMGLASAVAKAVVIEGVENAADAHLAHSLGGSLQQGFFYNDQPNSGVVNMRTETSHPQPLGLT